MKVLRDNGIGYSLLSTLLRRLKAVNEIDDVFLCTSTELIDDIMAIAVNEKVKLYRGSADNVIERMIDVGEQLSGADILIRITYIIHLHP